jgi:hypothetical protein
MYAKYTKYTIVTFANPKESFADWSDAEIDFINDSFEEALVLSTQKKTPGWMESIGPGQVKRFWIDQKAAEEWKQFIFDNAVKHGIAVSSIEIFDNLDS